MKIAAIVIAVIGVILGVGYIATNPGEQPNKTSSVITQADRQEIETDTNTETPDELSESTPDAAVAELSETPVEATTAVAGTYQNYDAEMIAQSTAEHIVLFFHATWCPSCRALDADITAKAATIPAGVEIYKIDFDTAIDLKRQYGITRQHSIIQTSPAGEVIGSVSHGSTLEAILATL